MTRLDRRVLGTTLVLVMSVAGTSWAQETMEGPPPETLPQEPEVVQCPEFIRGSKLTVKDVKNGVALDLTTTVTANVPMLRQLTRDFVAAVEQHVEAQAKSATVAPDERLPPLDMTTKDIEGGAQLIVRAKNAEDVATIRSEARDVEAAWATSECVTGTNDNIVL